MSTPTKDQFQGYIDTLKCIEKQANLKGGFDIDESDVAQDITGTFCGTVHCVAGWYLVAMEKEDVVVEAKGKLDYIDYREGIDLIVKSLGFVSELDLLHWAEDNPKIWGNSDGFGMFSVLEAYNELPESKKPMTTVIRHLEGVRGRLPE